MLELKIKKVAGLVCMGLIGISSSTFAAKPNVLMIMVDDMEGRAPGIFGGVFADDVTPNIDTLAAEGMRFGKAHVAVAVCQPSRQTIMTGKYSLNIGALGFTPISKEVTTLGQMLDKAGYINGIFHKLYHLEPVSSYEWSYKKNGKKCSNGRSVEKAREMTEQFVDSADAAGTPFFLMANTSDPHAPFYGTAKEYAQGGGEDPYKPLEEGGLGYSHPSKVYTEDEVSLPAFLADSGIIKEEITQYVNSCRRADDMVGAILDVLDKKGKRDNTIVIFLSDNGMPFPSAKHNTYFQSTQTPLIIRWPDQIEPGVFNNSDYVSAIDLMPTILDAAGIEIPSDLDGGSILPLLKGNTMPGRNKVVTTHFEQVAYVKQSSPSYNLFLNQGYVRYDKSSMTRPKDMRCLQSDDYGYIFNAKDTGFSTLGLPMTTSATAGLNDDQWWEYRENFLEARGPEEFYDFSVDPYGLNNLIDDPEYASKINQFRSEMLNWMQDIKDPQRFEFENTINGIELSTYIDFVDIHDGQIIQTGSEILSKIETEYVFNNYPKFMFLEVNGQNHKVRVRAPFTYDISGLDNGDYELRLKLLDNKNVWTYSPTVNITISDEIIDNAPPTPSPSEWISATPDATSIQMEAVVATDPSGVEYSFFGQKDGEIAFWSGWISDSSYTATGLESDTTYTLWLRTKDSKENRGAWSKAQIVTTLQPEIE